MSDSSSSNSLFVLDFRLLLSNKVVKILGAKSVIVNEPLFLSHCRNYIRDIIAELIMESLPDFSETLTESTIIIMTLVELVEVGYNFVSIIMQLNLTYAMHTYV